MKEKTRIVLISSFFALWILLWIFLAFFGVLEGYIWILFLLIAPVFLLWAIIHVVRERFKEIKEEEKHDYHHY